MKSILAISLLGFLSTISSAQRITGGKASFYYQGGIKGAPPVAGSCGDIHPDTDLVVAAPSGVVPANCGKTVMITNTGLGNGAGTTISAKIVDLCPSCEPSKLDLSVGAFDKLTNNDEAAGIAIIDWQIV